MLRTIITTILSVCLLANIAYANYTEPVKFSDSRSQFISEMEDFIMASNKKDAIESFNKFKTKVNSSSYNNDEFAQIVETSNNMLQLKMAASPYFSAYLKAVTIIKDEVKGEKQFKTWHSTLVGMLKDLEDKKFKPYKEFVNFSERFFKEKNLYTSSSGLVWTIETTEFEFAYEEKEASVVYKNVTLKGTRKDATIIIQETSGHYYPAKLKWKGDGGKVSWDKSGVDNNVYCSLTEYDINVKKALYQANNVLMHHPDMFKAGPVTGKLDDKMIMGKQKDKVTYPRFESKEKTLEIEDIGGGLKYVGGVKLHGNVVYGYGTKDTKANIKVYNDQNELVLRASSESFTIKKGEKIVGKEVEAVIYVENDSIYHPSVNLRFNPIEKELNLFRGDKGRERNPFFSSYHKVDLDVDKIDWYVGTDSIMVGRKVADFVDANQRVKIRSFNYYNESEYQRFQNVSSTNPISLLKIITEKEGTNVIDANKLAKMLNPRFDISSIRTLLYDLSAQGFVDYDKDSQLVTVKDKVIHYAKASQKQSDYDNLEIVSTTDETNAVLSLTNHNLKTKGIKHVEFNKRQRVAAVPTDNQITLKDNRDMTFDGKLYAGFGLFDGSGYEFSYKKNSIKMDSVKVLELFIPTGDKDTKGMPEAFAMASKLEHLSGEILIDAPENKSGKEDVEMFPSLNSKGAFVYYDMKEVQGGVYTRDKFFFKLDPFHMNSLDKFTKEDLVYKGTLTSHNIFPDFQETLLLQEDQSLGFVTNTPATGYQAYQSSGVYKGEIALSNAGLLGKGNIEYLGSTFDSKDITFKPEQMLATADAFNLKESRSGVEYPKVKAQDVKIDWLPYADTMFVDTKEFPFEMFNDGLHTLGGTLILTSKGLKGKGIFDWDKGSVDSELYSFGAHSSKADVADLQIRAFNTEELALDTRNVKVDFDFDKQIGTVKANVDTLMTTLPYNKYITSMNEFDWDIAGETITFKAEENKMGTFLSTSEGQDSLFFKGETAKYDLKSSELLIGGVKKIQVADALIYPNEGKVDIQSGGIMTTLNDAKIVANLRNKHHVINRATIDIKGKKLYEGTGFYEYNIGDKEQEIEFTNISGQALEDNKLTTTASGTIKETDQFYIDHKTTFRGTIRLNAESRNLKFEGFAKLDAERLPHNQWFSIDSKGDRKNLSISYDEPKNLDGAKLSTGLFLSHEKGAIYPRVMMPAWSKQDRTIFEAKGLFNYDEKNNHFNFGDSLKVVANHTKGNLLKFDDNDGTVTAQGQFNIGSGLDYINVTTAGKAITRFKESGGETPTIDLNAMLGIDFILPEKLESIMAGDFMATSYEAEAIDYKGDGTYEKALAEFYDNDKKAMFKALDVLRNSGKLELPKKNSYTIFFSKLGLEWNEELQSFVSNTKKIGLGAIGGEVINRQVEAYVEFRMPSNENDRFYIHLTSPSGYYYFFGFKEGIMNIVSNNVRFNEEVINMKNKDKMHKMKNGETYEIQPVNEGTAKAFVNRVIEASK